MRYIDTLQYKEEFFPHRYTFFDDKHQVSVPAEELFAYRQGELIQNVMVSVSVDDREWLLTGMYEEKGDR